MLELEQKVETAHATSASAALGDTKDALQMSGMEHVAAADDAMAGLHLSTIRDRMLRAGVVMPIDANEPIRRLFALHDRRDVIVGITPDTDVKYVNATVAIYETYDVFPINDAAIAAFGAHPTLTFPLYDLAPVTLANLKGVKAIGADTLRTKPAALELLHEFY